MYDKNKGNIIINIFRNGVHLALKISLQMSFCQLKNKMAYTSRDKSQCKRFHGRSFFR